MPRPAKTLGSGVISILVLLLAALPAQPQQVPIPQNACQVPGPAPGTAMTREYVQMVGRLAYFWGWPLVNMANRAKTVFDTQEPVIMGGMPIGPGRLAMLTTYMNPAEKSIECPNQDVVYGSSFFDLHKGPIVFQIPDFGERFWVYAFYDARTDEFSRIGRQYGTKPGFYLMVGPDWKGEKPAGITAVVRSSTALAFAVPRVFMKDTAEDHRAIQPLLNQVLFYPLSEFDGKTKTKDWPKLPRLPAFWPADQQTELPQVHPETFFDELPALMQQVPPLPGEAALYHWIGSVLEAAAKDPEIKKTLQETAVAAEHELITWVLLQWRLNGRPAGNGWYSPINNAQWGTDFLNRTATARSNIFENRPEETKYIFTDNDSHGKQLNGRHSYTITFAHGQVPPVKGFWSLNLYNAQHFFHLNPWERYSLGTKTKNLKFNPDGSLTLYAGAQSPGKDKESNWLPAPHGPFSLYIRAYWADKAILDGTWTPPQVELRK